MKVGIITWHYYPNFGSSLQAYALQESIKSLGADVSIINYRNPKLVRKVTFKDTLSVVLSSTIGWLFPRFRYAHLHYMSKYLQQTKVVYDEQGVQKLSELYDTVVFGSDQIWAPNVFDPVYHGKYSKNCKKVSYAASIGLSEIPQGLVEEYKENLSSFSHISVREEEGQMALKNQCGIDSMVVLDPTLLLSVDKYKVMERKVPNISDPFIFCYFLNANNRYRICVEAYAKNNGLKVVGCSARNGDNEWMTIIEGISACEFLWLIHHSTCIFTDSYHGTIFSLLYHKNFRTFMRFAEDDPIDQNSRIKQLNQYFGIAQLIQNPDMGFYEHFFDYEKFESSLDILKVKSLSFLKMALNK